MSQGSPRPIRSSERRGQRRRRPPHFELLQVVYVREAHPSLGLLKGEAGTIVETLDEPYPAYLVEFSRHGHPCIAVVDECSIEGVA